MSSKKILIIGIVIAAIAIPLGIYTALPLFINTEINEPVLTISNDNNDAAAMQEFKEFMEMSEEEIKEKGQQMSFKGRDRIMKAAALTNSTTVN